VWEQISVVGGALVVLATLVVMLFKLNKLSYTIGQMQQSVTDKLDALEKGKAENGQQTARLLDDLNKHCAAPGLHVNAELERRAYEDMRDWRKSTDVKLDELLKSNK
jgi:hypothetical protein